MGVLDPVEGFARIARATDCPSPFRMYDGRRAMQIATTERTVESGSTTCRIDYRVSHGPGHVSPFRVTRLALTATYSDGMGLTQLDIRAGPFATRLARR